jgi:hypothetical protein
MTHIRWTIQLAATLVAATALASPLLAQEATCGRFLINDTKLPTYPPIARAAHMTATIRFKVFIPLQGEPQISFLDGPSKGVWQMLVTSAHDYLAARTYGWFEGAQPKPCSYVASVEYRQIPGELDAPNNFLRITVIDEAHTIVEVKPTTPTVNY